MTHFSYLTRFRGVAFWAMVVSLAVAAVFYFCISLSWFDRPYPGFKLRVDRAVEFQLPPRSTGAQAGLMPGDRVLTLDGEGLQDPRALYAYVATKPLGTPITYEVERCLPNGEKLRMRKVIATQAHNGREWASFFLAFWLTGLSFLILGAIVSALKPGDPLARANFAFHMAGAASSFSNLDQCTTYLSPLQDPIKLLPWLIAMCFANLALQFPRRHPLWEAARRWNLALGLALAVLLVGGYVMAGSTFWGNFAHLGYIALGEVVLLANALWTSLSPHSSPSEKGQGKVILVGTLASTAPALLVPQAQMLGLHVNLAGFENFALPLWPLAISYAIARHQLFDIRPLIRRSLVYLLAAAVLTLLYVVGTTATEVLIGDQTKVPGVVATMLVAFAFAPVRDRIKTWLDARFFRSPYRFSEVIAAFTKTAQESVEPRVLMQAYLQGLERALAPTRLAILPHKDGPQAVTMRGFSEADLPALASLVDRGASSVPWQDEPMTILPLMVQDHVLGHVVLGPKKSDMAYTELDRALLRELTQLLAIWLNHFERFENFRLQTQEIEALKRSEAMQGQFLNTVSHELKIPLSVIMSSLNILERSEASQNTKMVTHLNRIRRNLTHLVGLVGDLLHAGQLESGHFQLRTRDMDLGAVARESLAEMRLLAEHKAHGLTMDIAPQLPLIQGDEARLTQVFRNMVHNAIRYTPANGQIHLSLSLDGQSVRCEIRDNGPGIAAAAMPQLFQRFRQVHEEAPERDQGVGLGLFICKAIVEAHGGRIGAQSHPGQGSTFWFTLPTCLAHEPAELLPSASGPC